MSLCYIYYHCPGLKTIKNISIKILKEVSVMASKEGSL